ncbi:MAG: helix-turn-helix domain-containing protein [Opitutaceae bacterium]
MEESYTPEIFHWIDTETPLGSLTYAGIFTTDADWGLRQMRSLEFYSLALLLKGSGYYRDATGLDIPLKVGDCIFVEPGHVHQYGCESGGEWSEVYLCFKGEPFKKWMESGRLNPSHVCHLGGVDLWEPRWMHIARSRPRNYFEAVELLSEIHLLINQVVVSQHNDWGFDRKLEASKQHLQSWPPESQPDWELLAKECGCSYQTWRKAFRREYGISPAKFRRIALMNQASRLMTKSSFSNDELAEQFGCSDGFHFSKLFKSVIGLSPKDYRNRVRGSVDN